jgi:lipopolysaccharide export system permease protein
MALTLVLQALDALSESGLILAHPGNSQTQVWQYIGLRAPQIFAQFLPFSVLLATIFTLSTLNQNSEVIAMKASGLSAHQVLAPLIVASLGVAVLAFTFNERIVSRATATLNQWKKVDYGPLPVDRGDRVNVWVRDGDDLVEVGQVHGKGNAAQLADVTIYDRQNGKLMSIIHAPRGQREGKGWRIEDATRFDVTAGRLDKIGSAVVANGVRPDQFTLSSVDADGLSFTELQAAIRDLADAGRPTKALEGSLWHKISMPLSSILMPLLGSVAAFGLARSGRLFIRAVIAMALGFAYFVADNFALAMGNLGAYPPFLAAWAPFFLFLLIGELVLVRTEE